MKLQVIKKPNGQPEYALLPVDVFEQCREAIEAAIGEVELEGEDEYIDFDPAAYVENPIALARIEAGLTQAELARRMGVTQAYVSKLENLETVSDRALMKARQALGNAKASG